MGPIYCFLDIEVDGPTPGANSMLSLGFAAFDEDERELDVFEINLDTSEGASDTENVMNWWRTQPEALAHIRRDTVPPAEGMERCLSWLECLGSELALAAHPLLLDGSWLDWYFKRFCNATVFGDPFRISCPFVGAGVDVPSYVQAALNMAYFKTRPNYPPELLGGVPPTHKPIDDARGQAALYFNAGRRVRTGAAPSVWENQAAIQAKAVAHSQPFSGAAERRALCPCNGHHPRTLATHSGGQVRTH